MKVILQQDVARLGTKNQEVEVSRGYALNKLIPSGQAVLATKSKQQQLATEQERVVAEKEATKEQLATVVAALHTEPLAVPMGANEKGQLFQAVSAQSIAMAATDRELPLTAAMVSLPSEPIKSLGEHTITLQAAGEQETVSITVVSAS